MSPCFLIGIFQFVWYSRPLKTPYLCYYQTKSLQTVIFVYYIILHVAHTEVTKIYRRSYSIVLRVLSFIAVKNSLHRHLRPIGAPAFSKRAERIAINDVMVGSGTLNRACSSGENGAGINELTETKQRRQHRRSDRFTAQKFTQNIT